MTTLFATSIDLAKTQHTLWGDLFSLTKARLSFLVIFTSALGLMLAPAEIELWRALVTTFVTAGLVAGACMLNCVMEKDIDAKMERTRHRPLPSGRVSPRLAWNLGLLLILGCLVTLAIVANLLTALLGALATLIYVCLYTPMKQKTSLALFAGAIPGAIPPLMGWTTVTGDLGAMGLALFGILFVWQLPHFLSISIYHAKDYKNAGLKTYPDEIGIRAVVFKIIAYTFLLLLVCLIPYSLGETGVGYRNVVLVIGLAFMALAIRGLKFRDNESGMMRWSRQYFYSTLVYLPGIFVAMLWFRFE